MFKLKLILCVFLVAFIGHSFTVNAEMSIEDMDDRYVAKRAAIRIPFRWGIVKINTYFFVDSFNFLFYFIFE